jgi:glycosyltransferase involved in cell wall biosynthesis
MKARSRVLLIRASEKSDWHSMNRINIQWVEAYRTAFRASCSVVECSNRAPFRIPPLEENDQLVLLDHHLQYSRLLGALAAIGGAKPLLNAHLFADFLKRPDQIAAARELSKRFDVRFFVASRWMRDEVLRELPGADVRVIPFPVSGVFFETALGAPTKRPGRWAYAGRIHPDKGLDQLLDHLLRAGGTPFQFEIFGWWCANRYESWSESLEDFEFRRRKLAALIGALKPKPRLVKTEKGLANSFKKIDALVFPSIFKGEEFGYALAQALAAGKPCWISNWRGHRDFAACPGVGLLPVLEREGRIPTLEFASLPRSSGGAAPALRRRIRSWARRNHSIEAVASKLREAILGT